MPKTRVHRVPAWNDLLPLTWRYHWGNATGILHNNGSGVYLSLHDDHIPTIFGGPLQGSYRLHRINFHWGLDNQHGAHHLIGDTPCAMEIHATYYNASCDFPHPRNSRSADMASWTVVGMLFTEGDYNDAFEPIAQGVEDIQRPKSTTEIENVCLVWLMRPNLDRDYFTYVSELPGTSSVVTWIVYDKPNTLSKDQIDVFRTVLKNDKMPMLENRCKLPINPMGKEIVFVRDIPFSPKPS